MSEVQRWNINHVLGRVYIDEKSEGGWVTYADHVAAVAAAMEEERQRINSMLVVDYVREQYERGAADRAAELQDFYGERAQGHYNDGYKMGYAKGLIEGDSGGRKEGFRVGYDTAWSLSAAEIERATEARVREEEQVAQTLARAELYSMEEMDERCTQAADEAFAVGVQAARDAVTAVQAERGYDAAINWSEIGNEHAEGWTDLLSLILPAIDAIIDGSRNTG